MIYDRYQQKSGRLQSGLKQALVKMSILEILSISDDAASYTCSTDLIQSSTETRAKSLGGFARKTSKTAGQHEFPLKTRNQSIILLIN